MYILFSTLCIASRVLSQTQPLYTNVVQQQLMNSDYIYFDEGQGAKLAVLPLKPNNETHRASFDSQKQQDSYLLGYLANRNSGQTPTQNANPALNMKKPSTDLQPPMLDKNQNNYYAGSKIGVDKVGEVETAPPNIPPAIRVGPLSRPITSFGLNLMKRLQIHGQNLVMSPFSISTLLALLQQGSTGITQEQITAALQMTPDVASLSYKNLTDQVKKRSSQNILNLATNIYIADAFQINPAFKSVAINNFNSEVTPAKFGNSQRAADIINNWVAIKTNNKITNLVSPDSVGENTQLVLVNAVYFKGPWEVKFNPDMTQPGPFYLSSGGKQMASIMRMRKFYRTGVDRSNTAQIIILPFEREQYTLMVILPSQISSIAEVLPTLTDAKLLEYHQFPYQETALELPKFTVRSDIDLTLALRRLGVQNIFGGASELAGIGMFRTFSPQVSSAVHSAVLSVDEHGGSAAAATAFSVVALSYDEPSVFFKVNRPFIAILWDSSSGVPLFMSAIENPSI